jgi:hypothetical protein
VSVPAWAWFAFAARRGDAHFWHEILVFFAGLSRKLGDEADTLEKTEQLRRVA